jgi:flagellar motor switch protein FliN/FliY
MQIKDLLKLSEGSVIELDRVAGESIDLLVNNKVIARGEVLVVN